MLLCASKFATKICKLTPLGVPFILLLTRLCMGFQILSPYHTGQLCRQFVRLFCWPTDLEHPHARRSVVIETLYPIITTNPLLPSAAYLRRSAKSFDFNLRRYHKKSYGCPDYKSVDKKNLS